MKRRAAKQTATIVTIKTTRKLATDRAQCQSLVHVPVHGVGPPTIRPQIGLARDHVVNLAQEVVLDPGRRAKHPNIRGRIDPARGHAVNLDREVVHRVAAVAAAAVEMRPAEVVVVHVIVAAAAVAAAGMQPAGVAVAQDTRSVRTAVPGNRRRQPADRAHTRHRTPVVRAVEAAPIKIKELDVVANTKTKTHLFIHSYFWNLVT